MDTTMLGKAGLQGWREKVGDVVAPRVASRSSVDEDDVRAAIGLVFFLLSVIYTVRTAQRMLKAR